MLGLLPALDLGVVAVIRVVLICVMEEVILSDSAIVVVIVVVVDNVVAVGEFVDCSCVGGFDVGIAAVKIEYVTNFTLLVTRHNLLYV